MAVNDVIKQIELNGTVYDIYMPALTINDTAAGAISAIVVPSGFDSTTGTLTLVTKYLHHE